jgi:hypothetical protein
MKTKTLRKEDQLMQLMQGVDLCMSEVNQAIPSLFTTPQAPRHLQLPKKNCWPRLKNSMVKRSIFS